ncbi:MAG TPA: ABC transporter permease [Thermomicrobiales bacterium]|jgi:peptide/nickel transport system permease protein|nr:ABC transporter permease [Thermomicrobiales bacterium]
MNYILRRIGFYLVAAWASLTLNFFLPRLMPGDPGDAIMARMQGRLTPETVDAMRQAYGLSDDPVIVQYLRYLGNLAQGQLGVSISAFPSPVTDIIFQGLVWTVLLGTTATVISFAIGSVLGMTGAWKRGSKVDSVMPPLVIFVGSFPYFWLATVALFYLSFQWGVFPLRHAYNDTLSPAFSLEFLLSVLYHLFLPALTIIVVSIGGWLLGMRNTMISTLAEDYVTMAEAKGLPQRRVMFQYAARNALLPNMTAFGMSLGFILGGALFTEVVFAYPGLGYQLITAVRALDYPLMQGLFLMITFAVLIANLIVDLLYVRMDPRVRAS